MRNKEYKDYPTLGELRDKLKPGSELLYPGSSYLYRMRVVSVEDRGVVTDIMSNDFKFCHGHRSLHKWDERAQLR